MFDKIGNVRIT